MIAARRVAAVAVAVGASIAVIVVGLRAVVSDAAFSDSEQLAVNRAGAATLDIASGDGTVELDLAGLAPGDSSYAAVEIVNDGTIPMRYTLVSELGSPLADFLTVDVWTGVDCVPAGSVDAPPGATTLATGVPLGGGEIVLVRGRRIGVGGRELLCYAVRLPTEAGNAAQGLAGTQTLTARAEQAPEP